MEGGGDVIGEVQEPWGVPLPCEVSEMDSGLGVPPECAQFGLLEKKGEH